MAQGDGLAGENLPAPHGPSGKFRSGRRRLLHGLQRISSSPSLYGLRRTRSASNPYSAPGSLSCVCLAPAGPTSNPQATPSFTPQPSPLGLPISTPPSRASGSQLASVCSPDALLQPSGSRIGHELSPLTLPSSSLPLTCRPARPFGPPAKSLPITSSPQKSPFASWHLLPHEIWLRILSCLRPRELVRVARVSKTFHDFCFDGQMWSSLDASDFYQQIPADSLATIIITAGPFIRNLNLRGCMQVERCYRSEAIAKSCRNLVNATLEGCRNFQRATLHGLLRSNQNLVHLNLTGLAATSNASCAIIAQTCPNLETLNVSWCHKVEARGLKAVIDACSRLKDLRAGEVRGFDSIPAAESIFKANNLHRLVLCGCVELSDEALRTMMQGIDPEIDILTGLPAVPPRKLRHLDLSRCTRLTNAGIRAIGYVTPDLEVLQLSGCRLLTNAALEPILASAPRLTHLDLEELQGVTDSLLADHLAKSPCATLLEHLSISYCESVGDVGMLPVMQKCVRLQRVDLDNTRISDLVLAEAAAMVLRRSERSKRAEARPRVTLQLVVYDCQNVTWTGIREVLFRNAQIRPLAGSQMAALVTTYPSETISLKCFYGFQMTVDEHEKRVLRGDFAAAGRLERKWADYMQASEEAGTAGAGYRRRRRRAREAQAVHMDEEDGGVIGRRRARTMGSCSLM